MNEQQRNDWAALRSLAMQLAYLVGNSEGMQIGKDGLRTADQVLEAARKVKEKR